MLQSGPIGNFDPSKPVRIYGAGLSGLSIGYYLIKKGFEVEIHEERSQVGGVLGSYHKSEGLVETAAHSLLLNQDIIELFDDLGVSYESPQKKLKRWTIDKDLNLSSKVVSLIDIIPVFFKLLRKIPFNQKQMMHISLYQLLCPLLGRKKAFNIGSLMYQGIYAIDSKNLTAEVLLKGSRPKRYIDLLRDVKKRKKTTLSLCAPKNGMSEITNKIYERHMQRVHLNSSPEIDSSYNNIICTNAPSASTILEKSSPKVSNILKAIDYKSVVSITFFLQKPIKFLRDSFGVLISQPHPVLGIISNSSIFSKRTTHPHLHSYTAIGAEGLDINQVVSILDKVSSTSIEKSLVNSYACSWKKSIPMYNSAHQGLIRELADILNKQSGVILFSNYTNNLSVREILTQAKSFSDRI